VIRVWEGGGSLPTKGWPVLKGIADFWVSRATRNSDGSHSIDTVIPPDEYVEQVDDSAYTNVGARDSLRFAVQAAGLVGQHASPKASQVADGLRVLFDSTLGIHPDGRRMPSHFPGQHLHRLPRPPPPPDLINLTGDNAVRTIRHPIPRHRRRS
jgi:hypothetical protein